jgi:hypothetical protein
VPGWAVLPERLTCLVVYLDGCRMAEAGALETERLSAGPGTDLEYG